jgi:hypothetical protein
MNIISYFLKARLLKQLAFYALLGSGAFAILLWSPNVLGKYIDHWDNVIIFILPWGMLWLAYSWQVLADREHRFEIILMVSIVILGIVNTALSDVVSKSTSHMRIFLVTGIFPLWASMFLLTGQRRRQVFDWCCCVCLAIIVPVEMIWWLMRDVNLDGFFHIFTLHPIPLGSLIILLSPGPIHLVVSKNYKIKMVGWLLVFLGIILIYFTHKRGTWLALAAMLVVGMSVLARRRKYLIVAMLTVLALLFTIQARRLYARLDPNVPRYASILQRVELYNFALHIWATHPFMGTGLRPLTHAQYLKDYKQLDQNLTDFPQSVAKLQTLDNMVLTAFVELGSLMTLTYLGLVIFILARYVRTLWSSPESSTIDWYRLLVILGFAVHSMTYDSLLFPPVNWLFHVQLGVMAAYYTSNKAIDSTRNHHQIAA